MLVPLHSKVRARQVSTSMQDSQLGSETRQSQRAAYSQQGDSRQRITSSRTKASYLSPVNLCDQIPFTVVLMPQDRMKSRSPLEKMGCPDSFVFRG